MHYFQALERVLSNGFGTGPSNSQIKNQIAHASKHEMYLNAPEWKATRPTQYVFLSQGRKQSLVKLDSETDEHTDSEKFPHSAACWHRRWAQVFDGGWLTFKRDPPLFWEGRGKRHKEESGLTTAKCKQKRTDTKSLNHKARATNSAHFLTGVRSLDVC